MAYTLSTTKSWNATLQELQQTFRQWGVTEWDTYTAYPRSSRKTAFSKEERGVTLRYTKEGKEIVLTMDQQQRPEDNLRVLYLAVEAMRLNEKRGIHDIISSAYLQLGSPVQEKNPYEVLGIYPDSPLAVAEAVYKAKALQLHPDRGGTPEAFQELEKAIRKIRKEHEDR